MHVTKLAIMAEYARKSLAILGSAVTALMGFGVTNVKRRISAMLILILVVTEIVQLTKLGLIR